MGGAFGGGGCFRHTFTYKVRVRSKEGRGGTWGSKVIFVWKVLRALGKRACVSLWWDLCAWASGVCARACVLRPPSITNLILSIWIINIQSCIVSTDAFASCPISEFIHTPRHLLRLCSRVACVQLLTINVLCLCHTPLLSVLSSTAKCGGDASSLVLSRYSGLHFLF